MTLARRQLNYTTICAKRQIFAKSWFANGQERRKQAVHPHFTVLGGHLTVLAKHLTVL